MVSQDSTKSDIRNEKKGNTCCFYYFSSGAMNYDYSREVLERICDGLGTQSGYCVFHDGVVDYAKIHEIISHSDIVEPACSDSPLSGSISMKASNVCLIGVWTNLYSNFLNIHEILISIYTSIYYGYSVLIGRREYKDALTLFIDQMNLIPVLAMKNGTRVSGTTKQGVEYDSTIKAFHWHENNSIKYLYCPHCNTKGIFPMPGNICPNCKQIIESENIDNKVSLSSVVGYNDEISDMSEERKQVNKSGITTEDGKDKTIQSETGNSKTSEKHTKSLDEPKTKWSFFRVLSGSIWFILTALVVPFVGGVIGQFILPKNSFGITALRGGYLIGDVLVFEKPEVYVYSQLYYLVLLPLLLLIFESGVMSQHFKVRFVKVFISIVAFLLPFVIAISVLTYIKYPGPKGHREWNIPSIGMEMVYVPFGTFRDHEGCNVQISKGFWFGRYEVAQKQYEILAETNPSQYKSDLRPVEQISWREAVHFCSVLTRVEWEKGRLPKGYEYRLPTLAEWEYAARGGQFSRDTTYSGSNNIDEVAWYRKDPNQKSTSIVGQKKPNELGLYDMSGNVAEWCLDWNYITRKSDKINIDPLYNPYEQDPLMHSFLRAQLSRVCCGGSSDGFEDECRLDKPIGESFSRLDNIGFRVVLAPIIFNRNIYLD
jgi:formylglycine-generating enzyme